MSESGIRARLNWMPTEVHVGPATYHFGTEIINKYGFDDPFTKKQAIESAARKRLEQNLHLFLGEYSKLESINIKVLFPECCIYAETRCFGRTGVYGLFIEVPAQKTIEGSPDRSDAMEKILNALPKGELFI